MLLPGGGPNKPRSPLQLRKLAGALAEAVIADRERTPVAREENGVHAVRRHGDEVRLQRGDRALPLAVVTKRENTPSVRKQNLARL